MGSRSRCDRTVGVQATEGLLYINNINKEGPFRVYDAAYPYTDFLHEFKVYLTL